MKSWILFYLGSIILVDILVWLDDGIKASFSAVLYFNLLLLVFFIVFLVWRYQVEIRFTKKLSALIETELDELQITLPRARFSRDKVTKELLLTASTHFSEKVTGLKNLNLHEADYMAAWVHEVKTPLTAMKLVMDEHLNHPAIRKIELEWLRLHLLIDQQLSISRLPSLESDYVVEKTALHQLASAEVRALASWCLERDIAVEFGGNDVELVADVKWCRFIIRQLLTNAIKYSPNGGILTVLTAVNSSGQAVLAISDEGPGIPQHELPRIFDKGFTGGTGRIHNAATGLGLYLAETVASKMGIQLSAESEIAHGTTIYMSFSVENEFIRPLK